MYILLPLRASVAIYIHFYIIDNHSYYWIDMFISILTIVYFYWYIVSIYIAICYTDWNRYNIVTMYYIIITVYYIDRNSDKVYRYKDTVILWLKSYTCYTSGNCRNLEMFTKNHITCNAYARINCIRSIDTVENFWTIGIVWRKAPIK